MKHEPHIRDRAESEPLAIAIARARVMYAAGDGVEHRVVSQWLMTWGERNERTFEEWLAAWDG